MATFPTYVNILRDGYSESRATAVDRTDMEGGIVKQAPVRSRVMVTRRVNAYVATNADYLSWVAWVKDTLVHGSDWFDWIDPVDGATKSARLVGGTYDAAPISYSGGYWRISFQLETWDG